jgi:hypothetical protein
MTHPALLFTTLFWAAAMLAMSEWLTGLPF